MQSSGGNMQTEEKEKAFETLLDDLCAHGEMMRMIGENKAARLVAQTAGVLLGLHALETVSAEMIKTQSEYIERLKDELARALAAAAAEAKAGGNHEQA